MNVLTVELLTKEDVYHLPGQRRAECALFADEPKGYIQRVALGL